MIHKIAFRNIWRNKLRSWVVITSIVLGIFGGLAVISTARGLTKMRQDNAIKTYVSHIQIHNPKYNLLGEVEYTLGNGNAVLQELKANDKIRAAAGRLKVESFVQSARGNTGLILNGVIPADEIELTNILELSEAGNFLEEYKRKPPIVLSKTQAERLNVKLKSTVQCTFTNSKGEPVTTGFKVVDIYETTNTLYDQVNAFVLLPKLQELVGLKDIHEIALMLNDDDAVRDYRKHLQATYPTMEIDSWRGIAPELGYAEKMMDLVMTIFLIIIMLALAFGIINTMLMAVLERRKELGMLLSVGMNKKKIFWMIIWESIYLALIAGPVGILTAYLAINFFNRVGIDLSFAAKGLNSVGLGSTIYPYLDTVYYVVIALLVIATALLSCIYPARKALKLNPSETLRTAV
jgi:putative ABC transport system permease protein